MGELLINLAIILLATLGGLYALRLIIVALIGPPTICECCYELHATADCHCNDDYLDDCDCQTCSCDMYGDNK